ncbi:nucleotide pyrophosphohydrolase [Bacterioplanoides sp.]|uniref:nucleotide pyrophosphohydrolase n=1 Tax=Bacterioplanoides sp. TaxID=2066072 RepID=UPI003B5A5E55
MQDLNQLQEYLRQFAKERDWDQFHSPKNLAMALSVEVSELLENFQWLTEEQSYTLDDKQREAVIDEIADVQIYLARLADKLNIDIGDAIAQKTVKNEAKYPADKVKGSSKKYTEYQQVNEPKADPLADKST